MKDGMIQDNQISASSVYGKHYAEHTARLDGYNGWAPSISNLNQWIQITFNITVHITGVITQGQADHNYFVTAYKVEYSNDDGGTWQYVKDIEGNDKVS